MSTTTPNLSLQKPVVADEIAAVLAGIRTSMDTLDASLGALTSLETTDKASLVAAINNAWNMATWVEQALGDGNALLTTDKDTMVAAINEVFTFANDGKTAVANAITAKGVTASPADIFSTLATKIGQIQSILTGTLVAGDVLAGKTGYSTNPLSKITGTMVDRGTVNITPGTANQAIAAGKHSGAGVVYGDSDLVAANILSNANIFGVQGTALAGASIKSVQRITVTGAATTQNVTISAVDITKSICFATTWMTTTGGHTAVNSIGVRLTSSTNLEVNITTANANSNCTIIIVEFSGNVVVQRGTTASGAAATISAVDISKSFSTVSMKGTSATSGTGPRPFSYLATPTYVVFGGYIAYAGTTYWEVVTFS